jgi:hypothetical protein
LLQRKIEPTNALQSIPDLVKEGMSLSLTASVKGQTGEQCFKYTGKCKDLDDPEALAAGKRIITTASRSAALPKAHPQAASGEATTLAV